ncbi:MAG: TNT domain-containing protein [Demequinaceae bacterium]|nr:TNT domain-containing protein [Demequinaceae bacterium]
MTPWKRRPAPLPLPTDPVPDDLLDVGCLVDQFGYGSERHVYPLIDGERFPFATRSLPYAEDPVAFHDYRILAPLVPAVIVAAVNTMPAGEMRTYFEAVLAETGPPDHTWFGRVAAAFGQPGGAIQAVLPWSVDELVVLGLLEAVQR